MDSLFSNMKNVKNNAILHAPDVCRSIEGTVKCSM